ncbi:MAG: M23 family metallopeptidase [Bacteroidales bacterium]|nr:M23 family metallopeptidase [Bacteroidales bacterium]
MPRKRRYKFNPETLAYELHKIPAKVRLSRNFLLFLLTVALSLGYYAIYSEYFKLESPKMISLMRKSEDLANKLELMNKRFEEINHSLVALEMRDNYVYRPVFGMEEIPSEVRAAGFGGVDRYSYLKSFDRSGILSRTAENMDILYKKAFLQSKSFDEVNTLAKNADELALCVPAIPPVDITSPKIRFSSSFGYRPDPFNGVYRMHNGIDISGKQGDPVYVTGNGKVVEIGYDFFGYGNFIIVDHGFGYKTRYAHLKNALISMGRMVVRGEQIGLMGNTGRSRGPHLHYEGIYRNRPVNPLNYYNRDIGAEEFRALVSPRG